MYVCVCVCGGVTAIHTDWKFTPSPYINFAISSWRRQQQCLSCQSPMTLRPQSAWLFSIYTHTHTLMHKHTYMCVQLYGARNMAWHLWANFALSSCVCECVSGYWKRMACEKCELRVLILTLTHTHIYTATVPRECAQRKAFPGAFCLLISACMTCQWKLVLCQAEESDALISRPEECMWFLAYWFYDIFPIYNNQPHAGPDNVDIMKTNCCRI